MTKLHGPSTPLLKAALRHVAASDGLVKVTLRVMGTNAPALRLFARHGFEVEGRVRAAFRVGDSQGERILNVGKSRS